MFKVGETYYTKAGYEARVVADDCSCTHSGKVCSILALITVPASVTSTGQVAYFFTPDGKLSGTGNPHYDLVSNEPTAEERGLIRLLGDIAEGSVANREEAMLKAIRQIRSGKK